LYLVFYQKTPRRCFENWSRGFGNPLGKVLGRVGNGPKVPELLKVAMALFVPIVPLFNEVSL
jgi:hypothetical protein